MPIGSDTLWLYATQLSCLLLVSGETHTTQGFWQIPESCPDPESEENRNISGSQITSFLAVKKQTFGFFRYNREIGT